MLQESFEGDLNALEVIDLFELFHGAFELLDDILFLFLRKHVVGISDLDEQTGLHLSEGPSVVRESLACALARARLCTLQMILRTRNRFVKLNHFLVFPDCIVDLKRIICVNLLGLQLAIEDFVMGEDMQASDIGLEKKAC